ncbi:MAG: hypothetical protein K940chlam3_00142 [Chlamydiae bacterium]|nr:hypothetical protein [Chlamydiota bacterium]
MSSKSEKIKRLTAEIDENLFLRMKSHAALKNVTLKHMVNRWLYDRLRTEEEYLKPPGGK